MTTTDVHMGHVQNTTWRSYMDEVCLYSYVGVMGSTYMTMDDDYDSQHVQLGVCALSKMMQKI